MSSKDQKTIRGIVFPENGAAIRKTWAQFVELCRRIGALKGDCVAIDGSKFKAVNSEAPNAIDGVDGSRFRHRNVPCWVL